jgi:hypothetical protein
MKARHARIQGWQPAPAYAVSPRLAARARKNKWVRAALTQPSVEILIVHGDMVAAHAAIGGLLRVSRIDRERKALERLLRDRRAFADLNESSPGAGMTGHMGIGAELLGADDWDDDGTYLVTLFFKVLTVPVYPLAAYVASPRGDGTQSFRRIPLTRKLIMWRWAALGVGALLLMALIGYEIQLASEGRGSFATDQ